MTATDASGVTATRHSYGSHGEQFGDLRLPTGSGPHPTIIYVHGGGYQAAISLDGAAAICAGFTAHGYATWSIEYRRLGNGGGWPTTFDDVLAGATYLSTLATNAPLDLTRVYVAGQSAGGQLALWLANRAREEGSALPPLRGVVALAPLTDMRGVATHDPASVAAAVIGGTPSNVSERYASTSPLELLPLRLAQLIVHGTADGTVPYAMSEQYVRAAQAAGDEVTLATIRGADHVDLWRPTSGFFSQVVDTAVATLDGWRQALR
ncbi:MAG TPA: alpha/beta hydrolase [Chloroflexota bacterium]|jgi:acetyl esterase/lipase|nr:alpha/beta hydrolase [Chloroflexota bacterium]